MANRHGNGSYHTYGDSLPELHAQAGCTKVPLRMYDRCRVRHIHRNDVAVRHRAVEDTDCGLARRHRTDARHSGGAQHRGDHTDGILHAGSPHAYGRRHKKAHAADVPCPPLVSGHTYIPRVVQSAGIHHILIARRGLQARGMEPRHDNSNNNTGRLAGDEDINP